MDNFFSKIKGNPLFKDISFNCLSGLFECLSVERVFYKKGDHILMTGDKLDSVGLLLNGTIKTIHEDVDGNVFLVGTIPESELFCDTISCARFDYSPITMVASEDCEVLLINYEKLMAPCSSMCAAHMQIIMNILFSVSNKAVQFISRIAILSKPTIRQKVLCFLQIIKEKNGMANRFTIPYNREEMAQYLCVNQSALSNELRKMSEDGLLWFNRNEFELFLTSNTAHLKKAD